jgi:predicted signal transduction protein with EAL and GGDEF domain
LLQEIGIAFAMFFIYISMQNPLEYMDVQIGIYNRNLFKKNINNRIHKKEDFGIICLQIEGLSYINEKFGLSNGNILLKQVAVFLGTFSKNNEVYRVSNRQLALVYSKKPDFNIICNEIMARFEKPFSFSNRNVNINLWGYLCCIQSSTNIASANDTFDIIDYSLNEARQNRKNSIVFASTDILEKRRREIEITQAVSNAIINSSFKVYFQPIYSLKEKRYTKMEALVRLIDENLGFIPPDEFIPIAEKNGDILAIGEIVLEKVCAFIEEYHPEDYGIKSIHVNLSVVQCMQENIGIRLLNIIDKYKIPHGLIDFEITESTADNSSENLDKIMDDFNKKGIDFSLDDYGTGYSNQSNLMRYPYSIVKIDKS